MASPRLRERERGGPRVEIADWFHVRAKLHDWFPTAMGGKGLRPSDEGRTRTSRVQWLTPVIPELWEAKVCRPLELKKPSMVAHTYNPNTWESRSRQINCGQEFEISFANMVKPYLY
ncbi:hypothetical protein AAY473_029399 [Plecturocebus cupreus]